MRISGTVAFLFFIHIDAALATCENIVSLSKVKSASAFTKSDFSKMLDAFCSKQSSSQGGSSGEGFSISGIGSAGRSGSSSSSNFSEYCQNRQDSNSADLSYKDYIESISPRAYDAYIQCERSTDVDFDLQVLEPQTMTMLVAYKAATGGVQEVTIDSVPSGRGVTCEWREQQGASEKKSSQTIKFGQSAVLQCNREDYKLQSSITVYRKDSAKGERLTIPWRAYNDSGVVVDTVVDLEDKITNLSRRLIEAETKLETQLNGLAGRLESFQTLKRVTTAKAQNYLNAECPPGYVATGLQLQQEWTLVSCAKLP